MVALPAAVKRDQQASTKDLYITQWPIGLEMACTSNASQPQGAGMNCTTSKDTDNFFIENLIGRWTAGNNTGASQSDHEEFADDFWIDVLEAGGVGSTYIATNSNSVEGNEATNGVMGNCRNGAGNQSSMFGGYTINNPNGSCMASLGLWPPTSGGPFFVVIRRRQQGL